MAILRTPPAQGIILQALVASGGRKQSNLAKKLNIKEAIILSETSYVKPQRRPGSKHNHSKESRRIQNERGELVACVKQT